jgi:hypothetical protein
VKGIMPLVTLQIVAGVALGPSVFGKLAPGYFQIFVSAAALTPLAGLATVAVLILSAGRLSRRGFSENDGRSVSRSDRCFRPRV